jgi:hypothetical protein
MKIKTKMKETDYKGFCEHYDAMVEVGCPMDRKELVRLAKIYNTPIPEEWNYVGYR